MDKMSIVSVVLVSFPEAFFIGLLGMLSIGKFNHLKDRNNILRLIIFAIIAAISSYFIRRILSDANEILLIHILINTLFFIFIMRVSFYESIIAVLFSYIILIVLETLIYVSIRAFVPYSITEINANNLKRFLMTIPERIVQTILAVLSLKYKIKIIDLENVNIKKRSYYIKIFVYMFSIGTLIFLAIVMTKTIIMDHGNFMNSTNTLLLRLNIYLTLFVTVILTLAIRTTHDFYKNKNNLSNTEFMQNLDYITHLIEEKNYIEAKESIDNLKAHINKQ